MPAVTLFVYGTLKRGERNHGLLRGQEFLGEAATLPQYRLYDQGRYPCLVEVAVNGVKVRGELWRVDAQTMAMLDRFEGAPGLFVRRRIAVTARKRPVDSYLYNRAVAGMRDCSASWP